MIKKCLSHSLLLFTLSLFSAPALFAQKQTSHVQQTWFAYLNQSRLSDKWGIWFDGHLRTKEDFVNDLSTGIARAGLTYYLNDNTRLTAGYAFVNHFPADNHKNISQPEHRPWQQVQWFARYPRLRLMQYARLEERYRRKILNDEALGEGYNFNWRLRYNFFLSAPLSRNAFAPGTLAFVFNDEVHVNFGREVVYNYFDQNRLFVGFSFQTNQHDNLQFGYMNLFQQLAAGNRYRNIHALRIFYFQNLDFRRKKI